METQNFGEKLIAFRAKHDLTQTDVAKLFGTDQKSISNYEREVFHPTRKNKLVYEQKMTEYERG